MADGYQRMKATRARRKADGIKRRELAATDAEWRKIQAFHDLIKQDREGPQMEGDDED